MAKKTTKKKSKKNRRLTIIFWVSLLLILIPAGIFGWVLFSSWMDRGSPILGDRYKDDLNPAITREDLDTVENAAQSVSGVSSVQVELATATLRVYADVDDRATADEAETVAHNVYNAVTNVLSPSVYFSQHDGMKMYDLEVHVYNLSENRDSDDFVYVIATQTSSMEEPIYQLVSEPVNAEIAQQLRDAEEARNNPQPTPTEETEMVIGSEDVESDTSELTEEEAAGTE